MFNRLTEPTDLDSLRKRHEGLMVNRMNELPSTKEDEAFNLMDNLESKGEETVEESKDKFGF